MLHVTHLLHIFLIFIVTCYTSFSNNNFVFCQTEEKLRLQQEKLELAEQNLNQSLRKAEALPKIEEELAVRLAALNEVSLPLREVCDTCKQFHTDFYPGVE